MKYAGIFNSRSKWQTHAYQPICTVEKERRREIPNCRRKKTIQRTRCGHTTMFLYLMSVWVYCVSVCVCVSSLARLFFGILQYEVATTGWYNCVAVLTKRPTLKRKATHSSSGKKQHSQEAASSSRNNKREKKITHTNYTILTLHKLSFLSSYIFSFNCYISLLIHFSSFFFFSLFGSVLFLISSLFALLSL